MAYRRNNPRKRRTARLIVDRALLSQTPARSASVQRENWIRESDIAQIRQEE